MQEGKARHRGVSAGRGHWLTAQCPECPGSLRGPHHALLSPTVTEHANQAKETLYEISLDTYDG